MIKVIETFFMPNMGAPIYKLEDGTFRIPWNDKGITRWSTIEQIRQLDKIQVIKDRFEALYLELMKL